jgi:hypothetical protein
MRLIEQPCRITVEEATIDLFYFFLFDREESRGRDDSPGNKLFALFSLRVTLRSVISSSWPHDLDPRVIFR